MMAQTFSWVISRSASARLRIGLVVGEDQAHLGAA